MMWRCEIRSASTPPASMETSIPTAATPVVSLVSPATGKALVEDEDLHGVVWDSVRCVRTLAHVIRSVGHVEGESQAEIRSTLRDAVDDLDEVLKKIEEGTR
mgnify:CR=1 FL=1